ncbi:MAG: hypothetical protein ACLP7J_22895 [Streptosporangiaceae bacterium]
MKAGAGSPRDRGRPRLVADYLAVGLDPKRSVIFAHSQVRELNQGAPYFREPAALLRTPARKRSRNRSATGAPRP